MNHNDFNHLLLARLTEVESDLTHLSKRMTRTQATSDECRQKITAIKLEVSKRLLDGSHERSKA